MLVSDFYSGYDSLPCEQQKCLIHLIRDFNADLTSNPYDEEFKALAAEFGKLLRSIVDTIDKHGLKKRHLQQTQGGGLRGSSATWRPASTAPKLAGGYQATVRSRTRASCSRSWITTGSPGTTIPPSTRSRRSPATARLCDGMMSEQGLSDYLVLLSVQQTCKYRGVSFLKFLLSQEEDVEEYCRRGRKKNPAPTLEVYPENFSRMHLGGLSEPRRKEIFLALVNAQDQKLSILESREVVAKRFLVSDKQVRQVRRKGWPNDGPRCDMPALACLPA